MADAYVVVQLAATFDEPAVYVPRDAGELMALSWCTVDARTLETLARQSILVRPLGTPVTPACALRYSLLWDDVKDGATFKAAMAEFDRRLTAQVAGKDFLFVCVDVPGLRVLLPREARDKAVVLPGYLQHPRVFDLCNEYSKWQAVHPEALSYPSSSLANVITALGVDVGPAGADESPDAYTVAVDVHAKILAQLLQKSVPVESHPAVLTQPYDAALDAKIFLAERSKILYLCNLPADTTHSELEAWFAQAGGRPIAFWTLKNLDSDARLGLQAAGAKAKTVCGFAVFSKHEEAAEALYMNGRVLMDRVVEVQASSTRVLDRASSLLTPFPPLKNRPRPGDWTCLSCGFSNFQRRIACFRCSFPATSTMPEQMHNAAASGPHDGPANAPGSTGRKAKQDERQSYAGSGGYQDQYQGNGLKNGNPYNSGYSHNFNHSHGGTSQRSHYSSQVPFRAGDWKCANESCQYHNFAKNLCCLKCGASKPAALMHGNTSNSLSNGNHPAVANPGVGSMHSVNNTAAAIAAATASGQPLNLNNSFFAMQQPLAHHSRQSTSSPSSASSSPIHNNGLYSNISHLQQLQFQQGKAQPNANLPQNLGMVSNQGHSGLQGSQGRQKQSQSSSSSPGLYVLQGYPYKGSRDSGDGSAGSGNATGISSLSNQVSSMSLNQ